MPFYLHGDFVFRIELFVCLFAMAEEQQIRYWNNLGLTGTWAGLVEGRRSAECQCLTNSYQISFKGKYFNSHRKWTSLPTFMKGVQVQ